MKDKTLYDIIGPLTALSKAIGLTPFQIKKDTLVFNKLSIAKTIFLAISYLIFTSYYLYNYINNPDSNLDQYAKAKTIKLLHLFRIFGEMILMNVILLHGNIKVWEFAECFKYIEEVDTTLVEKEHQEELLKKSNYKCWINSKVLLVTVNLVFIILGELPSIILTPQVHLMYFLVNLYPRLLIGNVNIGFFVMSLLLKERFSIINNILKEDIKQSHRVLKYPNDEHFSDHIEVVLDMHKKLIRVANCYNDLFGLQAFLCIAMYFILIIGDLHTSIFIIIFDSLTKHQSMVFNMLKNCGVCLFELYYLTKRSTELCIEANATKGVLLGIKIHIDKEEERNMVIASGLKLMQNKLEITACKLFPIDNTLLFSIIGAVSSYLFIMLQLDKDNSNNRNISNNITLLSNNTTIFSNNT